MCVCVPGSIEADCTPSGHGRTCGASDDGHMPSSHGGLHHLQGVSGFDVDRPREARCRSGEASGHRGPRRGKHGVVEGGLGNLRLDGLGLLLREGEGGRLLLEAHEDGDGDGVEQQLEAGVEALLQEGALLLLLEGLHDHWLLHLQRESVYVCMCVCV
jgi:hypothetical protein